MRLQIAGQSTAIERLAREHFANLTQAEIKLLRAAPIGEYAVCGSNLLPDHPANDSSGGDKWGNDREIRASVIRWLCTDRQAIALVDPAGVKIFGARITDALVLSNVTVPFPIDFSHCRLGAICMLSSAKIPNLFIQSCWMERVFADRIEVRGAFFIRKSHVESGVSVSGAVIDGNLDCAGSTFGSNEVGTALKADGATIKHAALLTDSFEANGEVDLKGATVSGTLDCGGGYFNNERQPGATHAGAALSADGIHVGGAIILGYRFRAHGEVRLLDANVNDGLQCGDAFLWNPFVEGVDGTGSALAAERMQVRGDVLFLRGFECEGNINLRASQIGGGLQCVVSKVHGALIAEEATIKGGLWWVGIADPGSAELNLTNASAGSLYDDEASWPQSGKLWLDGFVYSKISGGPTDAESRLKWLARQSRFTPQPYKQLAKVLLDSGDESGHKAVLVEMMYMQGSERWYEWPINWPLKETIGYGYYPIRGASIGMALVACLGWVLYRRAKIIGSMVPTEAEAYRFYKENKDTRPSGYPRFNELIFSLENTLPRPLIRFGQAEKWRPDEGNVQHRTRRRRWLSHLRSLNTWWILLHPMLGVRKFCRWLLRCIARLSAKKGFEGIRASLLRLRRPIRYVMRQCGRLSLLSTSPSLTVWFLWVQILAGWVLASFLIAGITGVIRKD